MQSLGPPRPSWDLLAQRPNGPTAQQPNGPTAQRPNGPTAQRPNCLGPPRKPLEASRDYISLKGTPPFKFQRHVGPWFPTKMRSVLHFSTAAESRNMALVLNPLCLGASYAVPRTSQALLGPPVPTAQRPNGPTAQRPNCPTA